MLRYLVLGLLRDGKPQHGYALMKAYCAGSGPHISTGNFYRELARLLESGSIETAERAADADARQAPYRITKRGAMSFDEWFAAPLGKSQGERVDDLALRLVVLPQTEPEVLRKTLDLWKHDLWLRVKVLERSRDQAASRGRNVDRIRSLALGRRLGHLSVDIELLDALLAEFGADATVAPASAPRSSGTPPAIPSATASVRTTASRRS